MTKPKTPAKAKAPAKPKTKAPKRATGITPIWSPSAQAVESAQMTQFQRHIVRKYHLEKPDYADFYQWTVDHPEEFWSEIWDFCGVIASKKGATVLVDGAKMPGAKWFPDARLNFAENLLRRGDQGDAFVFWDERGLQKRVSYSNLTSDVSRAQQALKALGLRPGDRAAAFIPNIQAGKMRALALTSRARVPGLPDVPTAAEQGIELDAAVWFGVVGPAGMVRPIVDRLNTEINRLLASSEGRAQLTKYAALVAGGPPQRMDQLMATDAA